MLSKTHLLVGLVVGLFALDYVNVHPVLFLAIFGFATLLPDIDSPHSNIGKKALPFSMFLGLIFGHRGFMHSIWIPFGILGISIYFGYPIIGYIMMGGYILHLLVDAMTLGGVRFFGPFGQKTKGFFHTGGITEAFIFVLFIVILAWKLSTYL